jgi:hypothetical protein
LCERASDLAAAERLRDQQHVVGVAAAKAGVGLLRRVADDHDRQRRVLRRAPHRVEQHLGHVVGGAVEHQRIRLMLVDQLADRRIESDGRDLVAVIAERERQQLRNLRRVID